MSAHGGAEQKAVDLVTNLLRRRLERHGVFTHHTEFYFQCEAEQRRPCPGGSEVRVKTWRHWSDATADYDADSGQFLGYTISRYALPASEAEMSKDAAIAAASKAVDIPADAELVSFAHVPAGDKGKVVRLEWQHVHQGMRVNGDFLWVVVHPETGRVIEYFRKWRAVKID